jgi:hypothetical protein
MYYIYRIKNKIYKKYIHRILVKELYYYVKFRTKCQKIRIVLVQYV